jgi:hypothetical protein
MQVRSQMGQGLLPEIAIWSCNASLHIMVAPKVKTVVGHKEDKTQLFEKLVILLSDTPVLVFESQALDASAHSCKT